MRPAKRASAAPLRAGVITSLVTKKGRSDRVAVYLGEMHVFDVAAVVAEQAGLRPGDPLSQADQERLLEQDAPYRVRDRALRMLAHHDRSRRELELRLRSAGFEEAVIAAAVIWLQNLGYLDNARFASAYAAERSKAGWGERRIRAELLRKGVEHGLVEDALGPEGLEAAGAANGVEAVMAATRKRFGGQFRTDPATGKRRLAGFLARRGYDWDTIGRVTRVLIEEAGAEGDATDLEEGGEIDAWRSD